MNSSFEHYIYVMIFYMWVGSATLSSGLIKHHFITQFPQQTEKRHCLTWKQQLTILFSSFYRAFNHITILSSVGRVA